jgi:beta-glucosidase-like glycosyl hydrolase
MKAVADQYPVASAAVLAVESGCDGVLVCSANHSLQADTLATLIHAVEEERLRDARVEDALRRHRRAKERFLTMPVDARPLRARQLGQLVGREEHRVIADEMARFV